MKKLFFLVLLIIPASLFAQDSLRTGARYGFLPEVSFNSDDGIFIGGELKTYNYGNGLVLPYKSFSRTRLNYKTNGAFTVSHRQTLVNFLDTDYRFYYKVFASQNFSNYFLGDTDKQDYNAEVFDTTSFYFFKTFKLDIGAIVRTPFTRGDGLDRFDLKTGISFVYETPWGNPEDSFINTGKIEGAEGATLTIIDIGLVLERRNSEFRAHKGFLIDLGTKYVPPVISTHHTIENYIKALGFLPLTKRIPTTLAARFRFQNTLGETPYWLTPALGGGNTIRGFIYRRFTSDNALSYALELRSWLIKIPYKEINLGVHVFTDGGRVFSNDNWKSILRNHKHSLGFGGVMSIFTPDYILKAEMAFSEDGIGIYLGSGYSF